MDWKQFVSALVSTLVWPALIVTGAVVFREPLRSLMKPRTDAPNPDDWKQKFEKNLEAARDQAKLIAASPDAAKPDAAKPDAGKPDARKPGADSPQRRLQFEDDLPEAIVLIAFNDLEETLLGARKKLQLAADTPAEQVLRALVVRAPLPAQTLALFESLRDARNAAVHTGNKDEISPGTAVDFRLEVEKLKSVLVATINAQ